MGQDTRFTPGPWQKSGIRSRSPEYKGHSVGPDGKEPVVVVPYTDRFHSECIANAHLISAAPDLFDALDAYVEAEKAADKPGMTPHEYDRRMEKAFMAGVAALAKARGEQ